MKKYTVVFKQKIKELKTGYVIQKCKDNKAAQVLCEILNTKKTGFDGETPKFFTVSSYRY